MNCPSIGGGGGGIDGQFIHICQFQAFAFVSPSKRLEPKRATTLSVNKKDRHFRKGSMPFEFIKFLWKGFLKESEIFCKESP